MFGTRGNGSGSREVVPLKALHHGGAEDTSKIGIFTQAFSNTPPTCIARYVDHWREGPVNTRSCRFERRNARAVSHNIGVETRGLSQWNWHNGPEAVDNVATNNQRNAEAAFFNGNPLQLIDDLDIGYVEYGTDFASTQRSAEVIRCVAVTRIELAHLANLLCKRHLLEQRLHSLLDIVRFSPRFGDRGTHSCHPPKATACSQKYSYLRT